MTRREIVWGGVRALELMAHEHGLPNRFTPGEMSGWGPASALSLGRYGEKIAAEFTARYPTTRATYHRAGKRAIEPAYFEILVTDAAPF
jgi:hypothetical protein